MHCKNAIIYFAKQKKAIKCFELLLFKWPIVVELLEVLKLPFDVTNAVQHSAFTLSDFYGSWLKMKRDLEKLVQNQEALSGFAKIFSEKVQERNSILLNNSAMICAVYLDPRFKFKLTSEEVQIAKTSLESLHQRIKVLNDSQPESEAGDEDDSFEAECVASGLPRAYYGDSGKNTTETVHGNTLEEIFESYDKIERQHHKNPILEFWNNRKDEYPELYQLACVIHSIPPTQATVERAFSTLGYIYNPKRTRLSPTMLENILLIRLNKDLVEPINRRDLMAATKK